MPSITGQCFIITCHVNYKELNCMYYRSQTCEPTEPQVYMSIINNTYYQQAEDTEDGFE